MNNEINYVSVDTYKDGCIYKNNAVVSKDMYSDEDWKRLLSGEEVPCEWDEEGEVIAWDFMSNDN